MSLTGYRAWRVAPIDDLEQYAFFRQKKGPKQKIALASTTLNSHIWWPGKKEVAYHHPNNIGKLVRKVVRLPDGTLMYQDSYELTDCNGPSEENWCEECGIYHVAELERLAKFRGRVISDERTFRNIGLARDTPHEVWGRIEAWGWTRPHQYGSRSQFARIEALYVCPSIANKKHGGRYVAMHGKETHQIKEELEKSYNVPVQLFDPKIFEEYINQGMPSSTYIMQPQPYNPRRTTQVTGTLHHHHAPSPQPKVCSGTLNTTEIYKKMAKLMAGGSTYIAPSLTIFGSQTVQSPSPQGIITFGKTAKEIKEEAAAKVVPSLTDSIKNIEFTCTISKEQVEELMKLLFPENDPKKVGKPNAN